MTNREFYKDKLIDIALNEKTLAVNKRTLKPCACDDVECCDCVGCDGRCEDRLKEWADSEYIEVCPFEKDELVEVSNDGEIWVLKYFSHISPIGDPYGVCDIKDSAYIRYYKFCQKYGTLGGLVKEERNE